MKLTARDTAGYLARPDASKALLIYGADPMRVADARVTVCEALAGKDAAQDMRLDRLPAADIRRDPAGVIDAMKAVGFFPGPRVTLIEDAGDGTTAALKAALDVWAEGDATLVVTAGQLGPRSALRKLFEAAKGAFAAGIYDTPPSMGDVRAALDRAGLTADRSGDEALMAQARALEPGDFRQVMAKLALYKHGDGTPVTHEDVAAVAPQSAEADLDDLLDLVADGDVQQIAPMLSRVYAQGTQPVALAIQLNRKFRQLHRAASDPEGASAGAARVKPPVFGPRRDRLARQAGRWGADALDWALAEITETDLTLRSAAEVPRPALVERLLVRLTMRANRRG